MDHGKPSMTRVAELYLASTPLQVLNAVETRYALGNEKATSVLVLFQRRWEHYAAAADLPEALTSAFEKVVTLRLELPSAAGRPSNVIRALRRNRRSVLEALGEFAGHSIRMVVVTNQWNRDMRYLAANARSKVVFADDGTSTAAYLKACAEWGASADWRLGFANRGRLTNFAASLLYRVIYGRYMPKSRPDVVFTRYRSLAESAGFSVVENEYQGLRRTFGVGRMGMNSTAHFLGAPLVDRGEVSESQYLKWLLEVLDQSPDRRWVYIPHPAESDDWLARLVSQTGMSCRRLPGPYELSFLVEDTAPAVIGSWFSSALDNLEGFNLSSELRAYRIPDGCLASPTLRRSAREFYRRHDIAESGVTITPLSECL